MPEIRTEPSSSKAEESNKLSRWGHIARLAIASYLEECISGGQKSFFVKFAPYSKYWKVRNDANLPIGDNPLERPIQIARYYSNAPEKPPQIFVREGGWSRPMSGLGAFAIGHANGDGSHTVAMVDEAVVSVELTCAAADMDDLSRMVHFVELAFGPMSVFVHRGVLFPQQETSRRWSVLLPLTSTISAPSEVPLGEDRQKRLWVQTVTMDCRVEAQTWAKYSFPVKATGLDSLSTTMNIPNTMRVGEQAPIRVTPYQPAGSAFAVSDFRKALILEGDILLAKRPGTITVTLKSAMAEQMRVYHEAQVTIVP